MSEKLNADEREKLAWCYHCALEAGDFETIRSVLAMAETDPRLEIMLLDVNERRLTTLQGSVDDSLINTKTDDVKLGDNIMQMQLPIQRNSYPWSTMLTAGLMLLITGAIVVIGGLFPYFGGGWNSGQLPPLQQGGASDPMADTGTEEAVNLLIAQDFVERVLMQPASIAVTEEIFTTSVTYHLPHGAQVTEVSNRDIGTLPSLMRSFATNRGGDFNVIVEHMASVADTVMIQLVFDYTFPETFDYQGTSFGTDFQVEAVWIIRIEDGQIAELHAYEDNPIFLAGYRYQALQQYNTALENCGIVELNEIESCANQ